MAEHSFSLWSLPPVNFISPNTIPTKNSYEITGSEQCFGYTDETPVQMYDLSEALGSCITYNTGGLYNILIIKYDGTNYTLLNEGVTSSSLINFLDSVGPLRAYLINSNSNTCEISGIITPENINGDIVNFYFHDYSFEFYNSTLSLITQSV